MRLVVSMLGFVLWFGISTPGLAEQNRYRGLSQEERKEKGTPKGNHCKTLTNTTYQNTCGGCHLAYPPLLLPSSSWKKIVNRPDDHFGEKIPADKRSMEIISRYLADNGADRSSCKKAFKVMRSLKGKAPLRITEVPYILAEHREISPEVFQRKNIGSLSNCQACHKKADQGLFEKGCDYSYLKHHKHS
jgi:hypothetical protein